ncbi:alpha/beta hydrolase [Phaeodactylibacter xiamenensis]|uniref:alpha/beta hydrolase n=1 Tax=Phaeodactylibacter xiamenensis TaxID=1524460 RepID=UPI0024A9BCDA|nr:alpha/beta hydrolase [Phaeodactylibacter xiamenensis]
MKHFIFPFLFLMPLTLTAQGVTLYKQMDTTQLFMETYYPPATEANSTYPALVFFHGGGWHGGDRSQFKPHAEYFARRGIVCFLVDYRLIGKHGTTPVESLKDAKSAIRYIRSHAAQFHIDTSKVIATGGSAGGQLAAATALNESFNEDSDNKAISCKPNALALFNPVIDNSPGGFGYKKVGDIYKDFSPLHNIKNGAPPTIIFLGDKDKLVPLVTAQYYQVAMERVGSRCELEIYKDQGHAFFNYKFFKYYKKTVTAMDQFLQSLGYLSKEPQVIID